MSEYYGQHTRGCQCASCSTPADKQPDPRAEAERELLAACEWAVTKLHMLGASGEAERLELQILLFREVTGQ